MLAAAWYFFAPVQLGGNASYVITFGTSMQPAYTAGDLAVVKPAAGYHVGEIVAYKNMLLGGQTVLHRIIGIKNGQYTFKGDNNNFVDSFHPTANQLVGKMWIHVPKAGKYLAMLHGSRMLIALALISLLLFGGAAASQNQRKRRGRLTDVPEIDSVPSRGSASTVVVAALSGLLAFGLLAGAAYTRPLTKQTQKLGMYTQTGHFTYGAQLNGSAPVYTGGQIKTGQPIFLSVVHNANFQFSYHFKAKAQHQVFGTLALAAKVTAPDGWARTLSLSAPQPFTGDTASASGTIDITQLQKLLGQVAKMTNVTGGTYNLTIAPTVKVHGAVDGHTLKDSFAPTLPFLVDAYQLQLVPAGAAGSGGMGMLTQSAQGTGPATVANTISLPKATLNVATARKIGEAGAGAAIVALLAGLLLTLRTRPRNELENILQTYGEIIVHVTDTPTGVDLPTVTVGSFEGLVRIAEQAARMILHLRHEDLDVFFIEDNGFVYTYQVQTKSAVAAEQQAQVVRTAPDVP